MSETITAKQVITNPNFALICFLTLCVILPIYGGLYGGVAVMVGSAGLMSVFVMVLPELFRSRNGSMLAAHFFVAALWIAAAVITAMTLLGQIRG